MNRGEQARLSLREVHVGTEITVMLKPAASQSFLQRCLKRLLRKNNFFDYKSKISMADIHGVVKYSKLLKHIMENARVN